MGSYVPSDYYETLRVSKEANLETIKSAYQKCVFKCHLDKLPRNSGERAGSRGEIKKNRRISGVSNCTQSLER